VIDLNGRVTCPRTLTLSQYRELAGSELGVSRWFLVDQSRIDRFAEVTEDRQFIHVDPVAAARTTFGATIAHGYLTLSLLSAMGAEVIPDIEGTAFSLNYGFDSLRFLRPVKVDSEVRGRFTLKNVKERDSRNWQSFFSVTIEIKGQERPALVAEWVTLTFLSNEA
jgi:acyl dehydratase